MSTLTIENIACIKELTIEIPEDSGGVLVLRGDNRKGKSTVLRILRGLLSGSGKLPVTDGEKRGTVDGLGRHISAATQTKYSGSCDTPSLEGKFDFSDLVRPMAKDPEARDRIRIKALLGLTGAKADPSLFYEIAGSKEELEQIVPPASLNGDDLVDLGGKVKRAFDSRAREAEAECDRETGYVKSLTDSAGEIPKKMPDIEKLRADAIKASSALAGLEAKKKSADEAETAIKTAGQQLAEAKATYTGPSVEEAKEVSRLANQEQERENQIVADINRQIADMQHALALAVVEAKAAKDVATSAKESLKTAESHAATIASLESALSQAGPQDVPSDFDIMLAKQEAESAMTAHAQAQAMEASAAKITQAKVHQERASAARHEAERLRDAAKSVDDCLTKALPTGALRAEAGRIVHDTDRGIGKLYDESSDGERWKDALPYGIRAVGEGGILAVVQDAWQDLGPGNRIQVAEQARDAKVWIITAEVAEGELRAEEFAV